MMKFSIKVSSKTKNQNCGGVNRYKQGDMFALAY